MSCEIVAVSIVSSNIYFFDLKYLFCYFHSTPLYIHYIVVEYTLSLVSNTV